MEDNFELNGLLTAYAKVVAEEDQLKAQKEKLKSQIIKLMGNESKYDNGYYAASLSKAISYKYPDELATIKKLKDLAADQYVVETIHTKTLNEYIRKNPTSEVARALLAEKLIEGTTTERLSVKVL